MPKHKLCNLQHRLKYKLKYKLKCKLKDYSLRAVTGGKDALGEVFVKLKCGRNEVSAKGASTDIIEASVKAYINAVNKLIYLRNK